MLAPASEVHKTFAALARKPSDLMRPWLRRAKEFAIHRMLVEIKQPKNPVIHKNHG